MFHEQSVAREWVKGVENLRQVAQGVFPSPHGARAAMDFADIPAQPHANSVIGKHDCRGDRLG